MIRYSDLKELEEYSKQQIAESDIIQYYFILEEIREQFANMIIDFIIGMDWEHTENALVLESSYYSRFYKLYYEYDILFNDIKNMYDEFSFSVTPDEIHQIFSFSPMFLIVSQETNNALARYKKLCTFDFYDDEHDWIDLQESQIILHISDRASNYIDAWEYASFTFITPFLFAPDDEADAIIEDEKEKVKQQIQKYRQTLMQRRKENDLEQAFILQLAEEEKERKEWEEYQRLKKKFENNDDLIG